MYLIRRNSCDGVYRQEYVEERATATTKMRKSTWNVSSKTVQQVKMSLCKISSHKNGEKGVVSMQVVGSENLKSA